MHLLTITPNKIQPGDMIDIHCKGWMTVCSIFKAWNGCNIVLSQPNRDPITKNYRKD